MKLAMIVTKLYGTGLARAASKLSNDLSNDQFTKHIVAFDASKEGFPYDGDILDLKTKEGSSIFKKFFYVLKRIYIINKMKKLYDYDITISFQHNANLINLLTRKNDKVIISIRSYISKELKGFRGMIYKFLITRMYNKADKIVPVSKAIKWELINEFDIKEEKIKVIYNYYNIKEINELSKENVEPEIGEVFKAPVIVTSGRLETQKGQWHLIRAFKKVKQEVPNAKLVILGSGTLKNYLKSLARDLDILNDIHFLGYKENPFKYIVMANLYVFPSLYEGFPNALSEAMACGVPVISSDCDSGPREILEPNLKINRPKVTDLTYAEYGVLIPVCDGVKYNADDDLIYEEELMADAIIELLTDKEKAEKYKMMSKLRMDFFSQDIIIKEWNKVISE